MNDRLTTTTDSTSQTVPACETAKQPSVSTVMRLEVTQIKAYEHNPRHCKNPEYDRIMASIRSKGMDQPLVVTCRPGETAYVVGAGGNTRLHILQVLYQETGDERFHWVDCLFKPWNYESDVLLAHLRENDLRSGLSFIDKAQAVFEAKQLLEQEMEIDQLSQRRLEALLRERGYSLSHGLISQMGYAVHTLLPVMPQALASGLGRPQVEKIRALDRAARGIWKQRNLGDDESFDAVFAALCKRYDSPEWDAEPLRSAIETEIAEALELSIQSIRVVMDAQLQGRAVDLPGQEHKQDAGETEERNSSSKTESIKATAVANDQIANDANGNSTEITTQNETATNKRPSFVTEADKTEEALVENPDISVDSVPASPESLLNLSEPILTDLKSLRARAWTLAARLAQRNGIGELVEPLSGKGLGFILRDVPDSSLADQLDADTLGQISMLWWQLAACAEMTVAPLDTIIATLADDSILGQALKNQDAGLLFNSVWTLDPGHTGYRLWRQLGERDWQDLLNLMDTYRRIHRAADDAQIRLWD